MPISDPPSALVTRVVDILAAAGLRPLIFNAEQVHAERSNLQPLRENERSTSLQGSVRARPGRGQHAVDG